MAPSIWFFKTGVTVMTILRGKVVWEAHVENGEAIWPKGKFNIAEGQGRYIARYEKGSVRFNDFLIK
jgi:hypothetical protein